MAQLAQVELTLDTDRLAIKWAEYTVRSLRTFLLEHQKAASRNLIKSIESELSRNGGNINKVITKFLQYGRFLDMGVGRGVPIGEAGSGQFSAARNNDGTLKRYRRRPLKWFSRNYYREVQRFAELYQVEFQKQIPVQIADGFNIDITGRI